MVYCAIAFHCYCATANFKICSTANFTISSTATVTALLRYCQIHNLFYCYSNCVTALLPTSQFVLLLMCYCATALLPTSQIYLTALLRYCQLHKIILLRYCATANFTHVVNVYIRNTLSWLSFQNWRMLKIK